MRRYSQIQGQTITFDNKHYHKRVIIKMTIITTTAGLNDQHTTTRQTSVYLSSLRAIWSGSVSPSKFTITGAFKLICNARVPSTRAFSYFVMYLVVIYTGVTRVHGLRTIYVANSPLGGVQSLTLGFSAASSMASMVAVCLVRRDSVRCRLARTIQNINVHTGHNVVSTEFLALLLSCEDLKPSV